VNILYTEASPGWGGQERRIIVEALAMQQRGHRVVMALRQGGGIVKPARTAGLQVEEVAFTRKPTVPALLRLIRLVRQNRIDLINTHSSADAWCGGLAARLLGKRVVRTRHLSTPIRPGLNSRLLYNWLADRVVTTCEAVVEPIRRQAHLIDSRCCSIPTGVDPAEMQVRGGWRTLQGIGPDAFLIGTVCVLRTWKGVLDLLEAAHLLRDHPNIRWVVVGDGINGSEFLERRRSLQLEQQVLFTGALYPPHEAMAAFDCFTLLSTGHEGVSQALLQAAYLSKPLITTHIGGSPEVCVPGKTGLLVDPQAPEQIAEAALWMANNRQAAAAMGEAAHQLVLSRFTRQQMADQMEQLYLSVLNGSEACSSR
jgi:glycosyltransferase involved in cell wall biosynthesis